MSDSAHAWFESYLPLCSQDVKPGSALSDLLHLTAGASGSGVYPWPIIVHVIRE